MTEGDGPSIDVFARQGLLGGVKVPILVGVQNPISKQYHLEADVDVFVPGRGTFGVKQQQRYVE
jgi:hypothetical protein